MRRDVPAPDDPAAVPRQWRVNPALPALKLVGAGAFVLLGAIFAGDPVRLALAAACALGLAGWAGRDFVAPVRLAAGSAGVTVVTGYAGTRLVPWARIERIRVDTRSRIGLRAELLEIDAGETLHLFSPYDLNAAPADVVAALEELRARATSAPGPEPAGSA